MEVEISNTLRQARQAGGWPSFDPAEVEEMSRAHSKSQPPDDAATVSEGRYPGASLILPTSRAVNIFCPTLGRWPFWVASGLAIVLGLILGTTLVYLTGGTAYAYPYIILLPVIFAGAVFKVPGGLIAAAAAALALGPWMPLNVANGTMQTTGNWLVRMGMYLAVGGFTGVLSTALFVRHKQSLIRSRIDPVTGLISPMAAALYVRMRPGRRVFKTKDFNPTHAIVIEFEGMETILSTLGSDASTSAIYQFGRALNESIGDYALVTRIYGSTFGILLQPGRQTVSLVIERLKARIPDAIEVDNFSIIVMLRVGIAKINTDDRIRGQPFRKPMVALHLARRRGRRVARYSETVDRQAKDNMALIGEFREVLRRESLLVHFQPIVDMTTSRVFAAEALVRWWSDTRGFISPGLFIPLIERTTLIDPMTRFVAEQAVRTSVEWCARGVSIDVSINISATLLHNSGFISFLEQLPLRYGVPASAVKIEITETAMMKDILATKRMLERLHECGFLIAVDDFGTGHSSLKYLKNLPIQWVKLDQSFVRDIPKNNASCEISAATAAICKRMNYKVIAEGVDVPSRMIT
ncbi:GGDEF domain-containing phosphodiesterase [Sediminimonas qiaohouensis]|uniref:GGDEF domain-containing phosphodiesterase n=1 Tax=Sediminimonas qiaohouensis TaxID=552061 RepID=UPI002356F4A7|nr:bifunctional diguanylate cyclase/phosphodiesterase [Sediminimonas qiaohouensis]